jgi:tripartite-type tricarboxylate transporter receptor subunit TctC
VRIHILYGILALAALAGTGAPMAIAQGYPSKPLRMIVPFTPGTTDTLARSYALRAQLGQPVVVDNLPGASGAIGYSRVAKSAPDGYTITIASTGTFAVSPSFNPKIGYDPLKDFEAVAMFARLPIVLVAKPAAPFKDINDLIAYARANPGKLNYASVSPGTTSHILGEMLKLQTKTQIVHVPYKGGSPAIAAILGGEVDLLFSSLIEAIQFINTGKMRALGMADAKRASALPNVPTLTELGLPLDTPIWYGIFTPAGTPPAVVQRLAADVLRMAASDEMKQFLAGQGAEPASLGPDAFRALVTSELAKYQRVVNEAGIKTE